MKMLLPPYILHLIFYLLYVGTSELFREELHQSAKLVKANVIVGVLAVKDEKISSELLIGIKNVSLVVCMLMNLVNFIIFFKQSYHLGLKVVQRIWSIVDIIINVLNVCVSIMIIAYSGIVY